MTAIRKMKEVLLQAFDGKLHFRMDAMTIRAQIAILTCSAR